MLVKVAWRNIWRKPVRSLIVIFSIAIGITVGIFMYAFDFGALTQRIESVVGEEIGHLQIHHPAYIEKDKPSKLSIDSLSVIRMELEDHDLVEAYSTRTFLGQSIVHSAYGNPFVSVMGITEQEQKVTFLNQRLVDGEFLEDKRRRIPQILIGERLAKKIKAKIKSRIILSISNQKGEVQKVMFKVCGIVRLTNKMKEERQVFVPEYALQEALGVTSSNELVIRVNQMQDLASLQSYLAIKYQYLSVKKWDEVMPEFKMANEMSGKVMGIMIGIILIAVGFGIINTMLMSVLERTRELGMLMAIGMNKRKVFIMILLETFFLTIAGVPLGLLLSKLLVNHFGKVGIDLSMFSESLESFGYSTTIFLKAEPWFYGMVCLQVVILAFLAAIYPALKALSLKPVSAIRKI